VRLVLGSHEVGEYRHEWVLGLNPSTRMSAGSRRVQRAGGPYDGLRRLQQAGHASRRSLSLGSSCTMKCKQTKKPTGKCNRTHFHKSKWGVHKMEYFRVLSQNILTNPLVKLSYSQYSVHETTKHAGFTLSALLIANRRSLQVIFLSSRVTATALVILRPQNPMMQRCMRAICFGQSPERFCNVSLSTNIDRHAASTAFLSSDGDLNIESSMLVGLLETCSTLHIAS
jgi:hypothetical protein